MKDLYNDVAVLKLAESSTAQPITLNSNTAYPFRRYTPLTVIGFGTTREGGSTSNVLKKLDTFFETIPECKKNYDVEFGTHVCGDVNNAGDCQGLLQNISDYILVMALLGTSSFFFYQNLWVIE